MFIYFFWVYVMHNVCDLYLAFQACNIFWSPSLTLNWVQEPFWLGQIYIWVIGALLTPPGGVQLSGRLCPSCGQLIKKQKKNTPPVLLGDLKSQQRFITWIRNGARNCISLSCRIESRRDAQGDVNCRTEPGWPESRETQAFVRSAVLEQRFISHRGRLVASSVLCVHPDLRATVLVGIYLRPES